MAAFDRRNPGDIRHATAVFSGASVPAQTDPEQAITGFAVGSIPVGSLVISISKLTDQAGLSVVPGRKTVVADQVPGKFANVTIGAIVPTAGDTYDVLYVANAE